MEESAALDITGPLTPLTPGQHYTPTLVNAILENATLENWIAGVIKLLFQSVARIMYRVSIAPQAGAIPIPT